MTLATNELPELIQPQLALVWVKPKSQTDCHGCAAATPTSPHRSVHRSRVMSRLRPRWSRSLAVAGRVLDDAFKVGGARVSAQCLGPLGQLLP